MRLAIQKTTTLQGHAVVPGSKSQSIRALILATLCAGESTLTRVLRSEDTAAALTVCQQLGARFTAVGETLAVVSAGLPLPMSALALNTGNSGITTRFMLPLLGLRENYTQSIIVDCGAQMRARPIASLVTALNNLGMTIEYLEQNGLFPLKISGRLSGGSTTVAGVTSQYLSALLFALPCADNDSEIRVRDLNERPYIQMTLDWLDKQSIDYTHQQQGNEDIFQIKGKQRYKNFTARISGDFSSASYLIAAAVLSGDTIELQGLDMNDRQGDKRLVALLQSMGADIIIQPASLIIHGKKPLQGIDIDANDIPDLLPTLAIIGTQAAGVTRLTNVRQARIKETDRIHSMTCGLRKMGARVEEWEEGMTIYQSKLHGAAIEGFDDHRTVMAFALAGLLAEGVTLITDGNAINKTFPDFINIMRSLGANMNLLNASENRL